jgi:hypothetical protein
MSEWHFLYINHWSIGRLEEERLAMRRWLTWSICSALALVAAAIAFLNFWSAADLGYDIVPGGKTVMARWGYAVLGFFAAAVISAVMAARARSTNR